MKTDFSIDSYRKIIEFALEENYSIIPFREYKKNQNTKKMILRHDIDLSLDMALKLAEIENKLKISATYFILLSNDFYNSFSKQSRNIIRKIVSLGHEIGLHWNPIDFLDYDTSKDILSVQIKLLESISNQKILSLSKHFPAVNTDIDINTDGYIDAYDNEFMEKFTYISDSSMRWRKYTPLDLIKKSKNIHFLSHPIWYISKGVTIEEKVYNCMEEKEIKNKEPYTEFINIVKKNLKERDRMDKKFIKNLKERDKNGSNN